MRIYQFFLSMLLLLFLQSEAVAKSNITYATLKREIKAEIDPISAHVWVIWKEDDGVIEISTGLDDCFVLGLENEGKDSDLAALAFRVIGLEKDLQDTPLAGRKTKLAISNFESSLVPLAGTENFEASFKSAARKLVSRLNNMSDDIEVIEQEGECGGEGGVEVTIVTEPKGGDVSVIPTYFFKACKATGIDPFDQDKCDGWFDVLDSTASLGGRYRYLAKWKNGGSKTGPIECRNGCEEGKVFTIHQ